MKVVDPRMPRPVATRTAARRPTSYDGARIVVFDNGKLGSEYGSLAVIAPTLRAGLAAALPGATLLDRRDDLLAGGVDRCAELADSLAAEGVSAVVLGLCDWGVSLPTVLLAAELEARGVPTSTVALEVGRAQTTASGDRLLPGLPVSVLPVTRHSAAATVTAAVGDAVPGIVAGLTEPVRAKGFTGPFRETDELAIDDADPSAALTALLAADGLGDGFPVVAPTPCAVDSFLGAAGYPADHVVWPAVPPREEPVVAREIATLAVLAGAPATAAPVVFAAYQAMAAPEFRLFQAAITTHPSGTLVLVRGPHTYGVSAGAGSLGPGHPVNATVGRAVALSYSFLLGSLPGSTDMTAQGSPAEFSYCCAEAVQGNPWPVPRETTVTVLKAEGPHAVLDSRSVTPEGLLGTFADTMATVGANNAYVPGAQSVVLLNREHAAILGDAGWSRADVRRFLFEHARNPAALLADRGIAPLWPESFAGLDPVPVVTTADDVLVTVTGGPGPSSQVALPWGYSRGVTRPVLEKGPQ
jgi:hypothetical protein